MPPPPTLPPMPPIWRPDLERKNERRKIISKWAPSTVNTFYFLCRSGSELPKTSAGKNWSRAGREGVAGKWSDNCRRLACTKCSIQRIIACPSLRTAQAPKVQVTDVSMYKRRTIKLSKTGKETNEVPRAQVDQAVERRAPRRAMCLPILLEIAGRCVSERDVKQRLEKAQKTESTRRKRAWKS